MMLHALTERAHCEALHRTGFYGEQAAGCIPVAITTGRMLLLKRSAYVQEPGTWGNPGGAHHVDEAPAAAALRELREETGYAGPVELYQAKSFEHGSFRYSNFIALVGDEFTPELNWESDDFAWVHSYEPPEPLHFGVRALLGGESWLTTSLINDLQRVCGSRARRGPSDAQRKWLAGSRIVDPLGEPLVAYHGSAFVFEKFDLSKAGSGLGLVVGARALFFSLQPWTATVAAIFRAQHPDAENRGVVYPVYLRAFRPCVSPLTHYSPQTMFQHIEEARRQGHDVIIFPNFRDEPGTLAVMGADQVLSIFDTEVADG